MGQRGILTVVSGFSGVGKGALIRTLMQKYPGQYALSISATTRAVRPGEQHGREYFFLDKDEFEELIAKDALIEHACYVGNYYGTPKDYVLKQVEDGKDVILEIEIQGALKVKEKFPGLLLVFVVPPNIDELEKRLRGRGTETEEVIMSRLARAAREAEDMGRYDYIVVNDELEACARQLHGLIQSQHMRTSENASFIACMKGELGKYLLER